MAIRNSINNISKLNRNFKNIFEICYPKCVKDEIKFIYIVFSKLVYKNKTISNVYYKTKRCFYCNMEDISHLSNGECNDNNNKQFLILPTNDDMMLIRKFSKDLS